MRSPPPKPGLYTIPGGVFSLSAPALKEFLQAVLAQGAAFRFRARGVSMLPFIRDGDVITVSPCQGTRLVPGEVLAYCHPNNGGLVVHRLLKKTGQGFFLQGDNCPVADGPVPRASIIGRVTKVERDAQPVRLGWGVERRVLELLARFHLLQPLLYRTRQLLIIFLKRCHI